MTSLTSIPAYLWRNTLQRWAENPASPATKFLVPFLFSLLAFCVFGFIRGVQVELEAQLARSDLRTITLSEFVQSDNAHNQYQLAIDGESPWAEYCEKSDLLLPSPIFGSSKFFPRLPLIGYISSPSFCQMPNTRPGEPRSAIIFTSDPAHQAFIGNEDQIKISDQYHIAATITEMPEQLSLPYQTKAVALVPAEMLEPALSRTHTRLQILLPKHDVNSRYLESIIRNYANAEDQDLRIFSAQSIIDQLQLMSRRQELARVFLGVGIALILSLVLGSLSLLEFRQELYLFSLLRSFGVKARKLLIHYLMETSLLTSTGALLALWIARYMIPSLIQKVSASSEEAIPYAVGPILGPDLYMLVIALLIGVILSALPLLSGLRKQAGLFLP